MAACSTTGIPLVSSPGRAVYLALVLVIMAGFSVYDIRYRRLPDWMLVCFMPVAALSLAFFGVAPSSEILFYGLLGMVAGGLPLLAGAIASGDGDGGLGGGDIKLAALLGLVYGPYGIMAVLLIAVFAVTIAGSFRRGWSLGQALHLPFVPFLLIGCAAVTSILIFRC